MADTKISALSAVAAVLAAQEFAVNDAGTSKKATAAQIKTWLNEWTFLGFTELGSDNANITVTLSVSKKFLRCYARVAGYSGSDTARWRFNGDTAANYGAVASEPADAAATSTINTAGILVGEAAQTTPRAILVADVVKEATGRVAKLRGHGIDDTESIGTALVLTNHGGLWNNTSSLITSVTLNGGSCGASLLTGSWVAVWGSDNTASA